VIGELAAQARPLGKDPRHSDLIQRTTAHDGRNTGSETTHLKSHLEPGRCYVTDRHYHDVGLFNAIHDAPSHYVCRAREDLAFEVVGADLPVPLDHRTVLPLSEADPGLPPPTQSASPRDRHFPARRDAVIACLLINLYTGKKPNKRMVEMIGWYLIGLATRQDVIDLLNRPDNTGVKLRAKEELRKKLGYSPAGVRDHGRPAVNAARVCDRLALRVPVPTLPRVCAAPPPHPEYIRSGNRRAEQDCHFVPLCLFLSYVKLAVAVQLRD